MPLTRFYYGNNKVKISELDFGEIFESSDGSVYIKSSAKEPSLYKEGYASAVVLIPAKKENENLQYKPGDLCYMTLSSTVIHHKDAELVLYKKEISSVG